MLEQSQPQKMKPGQVAPSCVQVAPLRTHTSCKAMRAVWLVVLSLAAQLVSAQYSCQKDDRCFDDIYTCTDCCNDGMSANNLPCWDKLGSFSSARCCTQGATATIESIMTVINNRAADLSTLATALKAGDLTGALAGLARLCPSLLASICSRRSAHPRTVCRHVYVVRSSVTSSLWSSPAHA